MPAALKEVSMMKKITLAAMAVWVATACIAGCKGSIADTPVFAADLRTGQPILVRVAVVETAAGLFELRATGIDAMPPQCGEENEDDDDEGEAGDNDNVEEECEDGLTPDGLPCADDDDEGEGNKNEEECGEMESESFEMIAAPVDRSIDSGNVLRLMGIDLELPLSAGIQTAANVRFLGAYSADLNLFKVTDLATTRSATYRLMTRIQSIEKLPDGKLALGLFNVKVIVEPGLRVRTVKSLSQDVAEDLDGDIFQCEQEGEHEGENEGCP
jgi:hypothetical protein